MIVNLCIEFVSRSIFIPVQGYTETPLIAAIRLGFESIARILVQSPNININIQDSEGKSGGETDVY